MVKQTFKQINCLDKQINCLQKYLPTLPKRTLRGYAPGLNGLALWEVPGADPAKAPEHWRTTRRVSKTTEKQRELIFS
jgi:hypothetical protein